MSGHSASHSDSELNVIAKHQLNVIAKLRFSNNRINRIE